MNLTSNSTNSISINSKICTGHEIEDMSFRLGVAHVFIFCFSICCNMIFYFLEHNQKAYSKLKNAIEFLRSVLAGVIISLFFNDQFTQLFIAEGVPGLGNCILKDLPFFLVAFSYLIIVKGLFFRAIFMKKVNEIKKVSNDVETLLLENNVPTQQELSQPKGNVLEKLSKIFKSSFTTIGKKCNYVIREVDKHYEPLVYLVIVFIHAFFAGLGITGRQYFGWIDLIILGHKIVEIFRVKQACKNLNLSRLKSIFLMAIFIILTPSSLLFRRDAMIVNLKFGNFLATKIFDNYFAQSFFIMSCVELLIPFPTTWVNIGLNWVTTFFSYLYFKLYFEKNTITL